MTRNKQMVLVVSAIWLLIISSHIGAKEVTLSLKNTVGGSFSKQLDIPLHVLPGDYIEGEITITKGEINLGLHDSRSEQSTEKITDKNIKKNVIKNTNNTVHTAPLTSAAHKMRLLLESVSSHGIFRFVATESTLGLRLLSNIKADVEIATKDEMEVVFNVSITKHIPLKEQNPPPREYLSPKIAKLALMLSQNKPIEKTWFDMIKQGTPFIEPLPTKASTPEDIMNDSSQPKNVIMTFVYQGAKNNVRLFGAPSSDHDYLEQLTGTNIWFKSYIVPPTTRLSYKLAPDIPDFAGSEWERRVALIAKAQADPLNKSPWPKNRFDNNFSPFNYDSTVSLVELSKDIYLKHNTVAQGKLIKHRFSSKLLNNERNIWLYTSANFDVTNTENSNSVLLLQFDGKKFINKIPVPVILDNLIHQAKLPPVVAIFVDNPTQYSRTTELPDNALFAQALAEEILPWAKQTLKAKIDANNTVVAGASFGGLAASSVALRYPEHFGNVLSMSGSYWWSPQGTLPENEEHTSNWVASNDTKPVRFFLSAGLFERSQNGSIGLLETNRHLQTVLKAKGYNVIYKEFAAGHDDFSWQEGFTEGMLALFGIKMK